MHELSHAFDVDTGNLLGPNDRTEGVLTREIKAVRVENLYRRDAPVDQEGNGAPDIRKEYGGVPLPEFRAPCDPGSEHTCYSGTPGTENIGVCRAGTETCNSQGTGYRQCIGEVVEQPEICDELNNDCDKYVNEDLGTTNCGLGICEHTVENCVSGVPQVCNPFEGAMDEVCDNAADDDCDGEADEGCTISNCVGASYSGHDYAICQGQLDVPQSEDFCTNLGMSLAFVDDWDENVWIVDTALGAFGYVDYEHSSYWIANTKENSPLFPWAPVEPSDPPDQCINLLRYSYYPYLWNDADCTYWTWGWVCESN